MSFLTQHVVQLVTVKSKANETTCLSKSITGNKTSLIKPVFAAYNKTRSIIIRLHLINGQRFINATRTYLPLQTDCTFTSAVDFGVSCYHQVMKIETVYLIPSIAKIIIPTHQR